MQTIGLVVDLDGQILELRQVLAAVVGTEQKLAPGDEAGEYVRLCATAVAAVG
jgi:hypothetical protein